MPLSFLFSTSFEHFPVLYKLINFLTPLINFHTPHPHVFHTFKEIIKQCIIIQNSLYGFNVFVGRYRFISRVLLVAIYIFSGFRGWISNWMEEENGKKNRILEQSFTGQLTIFSIDLLKISWISVTKGTFENNANMLQRLIQTCSPFFGLAAILVFLLIYHGYLSQLQNNFCLTNWFFSSCWNPQLLKSSSTNLRDSILLAMFYHQFSSWHQIFQNNLWQPCHQIRWFCKTEKVCANVSLKYIIINFMTVKIQHY